MLSDIGLLLLGSSANGASRSSLKRPSSEPDNQDPSPRSAKRLKGATGNSLLMVSDSLRIIFRF